MKPFAAGDRLALTTADDALLGVVELDAVEPGLLLGDFRPAPTFAPFAELFREFEEQVEACALAVLPEIERRIAALGIRVGREGERPLPAGAVQIYSDGGFSCRPLVPAEADDGHAPAAERPATALSS